MSRSRERILQEADLSPDATKYQLVQTALALAATVVGIVVLPVVLPIVRWYYERYYANLRVILTSRDLKVHRGILIREEKTIPLEKITDLRVYQGPLMRRMGLKGLAVETAGQTSQSGALVSLVGIEDTDGFRDAALNQRDRISDPEEEAAATVPTPGAGSAPAHGASAGPTHGGAAGPRPESTPPHPPAQLQEAMLETLGEIRDALERIEERLAQDPSARG